MVLQNEFSPNKAEMVRVVFEDDTEEVMPKLRYEMVLGDSLSNLSAVQAKISQDVGSILYGVLQEYGIKMGEVEMILNTTSDLVNGCYAKARDIKWGCSHEYLPMLEINKVLLDNYAKQQSVNGIKSTGDGPDIKNKN